MFDFEVSPIAELIMQQVGILSDGEPAKNAFRRTLKAIDKIEKDVFCASDNQQFMHQLCQFVAERKIVFSSQVLNHAGRSNVLTSCVVPPVDLRHQGVRNVVDNLHKQGMGTGFDLTNYDDPVAILHQLNIWSNEFDSREGNFRPAASMATLSIYHPKILDFIETKVDADKQGLLWKFNLSVTLDDKFMAKLKANEQYQLLNGNWLSASQVFSALANAAHACGDPGLVFLERMNQHNPTPKFPLVSTAPCAETGLASGETCQFSSVNLGKIINKTGTNIDYVELKKIVIILVRALDDALELTIRHTTNERMAYVMQQKRKIAIGVCGLADLLATLRIPYDSQDAQRLFSNIMSFINYHSKHASINLARARGSFLAIPNGTEDAKLCNR